MNRIIDKVDGLQTNARFFLKWKKIIKQQQSREPANSKMALNPVTELRPHWWKTNARITVIHAITHISALTIVSSFSVERDKDYY